MPAKLPYLLAVLSSIPTCIFLVSIPVLWLLVSWWLHRRMPDDPLLEPSVILARFGWMMVLAILSGANFFAFAAGFLRAVGRGNMRAAVEVAVVTLFSGNAICVGYLFLFPGPFMFKLVFLPFFLPLPLLCLLLLLIRRRLIHLDAYLAALSRAPDEDAE